MTIGHSARLRVVFLFCSNSVFKGIVFQRIRNDVMNHVRLLVTLTLVAFTLLCSCSRNPHVADYDFNTVFAPKPYSDFKLNRITIGMSKEEVTSILGQPLKEDTIEFLHCVVYANTSTEIDPTAAQFHGVGTRPPYLALWFSAQGKVNFVFNNEYYKGLRELEGLSIDEIIEFFGEPQDELQVHKCNVLSYSRLVEGGYTGHNGDIYVRRVYLDETGKVISVESGKGTGWDLYSGLMDNVKN